MLASATTIVTILAAERGGMDPMLLVGIVMVALTILLGTINMQRRRKTRTPDMGDYVRAQAAKIRQKQGVQEDLEQIVVQITELARQLNAQMDTRFAKLDQVIGEADEKIAALEALLRQAAGVRGVDVTVDDSTAGEATAPTDETPAAAAGKSRKTGKKGVKAEKAPGRGDQPAGKTDGPPAKDPASPADPDTLRYGRIYTLADQGLPVIEISRQVGQTAGEIELILNLRKSRAR
jgi:hypothetical protein